MKEIMKAEIDELVFGLWDGESEEWISDTDQMVGVLTEAFENDQEHAARIIVDSLISFVDELKERLQRDLADCYKAAQRNPTA